MEIPLFPLNAVLFPGGRLPLRIFEQRYMDMAKACLREDRPFGVCLIREGKEVGSPAIPVDIGCLALEELEVEGRRLARQRRLENGGRSAGPERW